MKKQDDNPQSDNQDNLPLLHGKLHRGWISQVCVSSNLNRLHLLFPKIDGLGLEKSDRTRRFIFNQE